MKLRKLKLGHLYPLQLNLYGDIGNVIALKKRCEWRDIELEIDNINLGDNITEHDIYFIGGGQDRQQVEVSIELQKYKSFLHEEMNNDSVFLGICGGYQLFGEYYQPHNADRLNGIELLDAYTVAGHNRFIGNVTVKTNFVEPNTLVGFENHSGLTYLRGETKPLGEVVIGRGNNGEDRTEGAKYKNVFGTYLHGSFLPKNPHFTDYLISLALIKKYGEAELTPLDDKIEFDAHAKAVSRAY